MRHSIRISTNQRLIIYQFLLGKPAAGFPFSLSLSCFSQVAFFFFRPIQEKCDKNRFFEVKHFLSKIFTITTLISLNYKADSLYHLLLNGPRSTIK